MSEFSWRDFQIWFEGFSENVKGTPNAKQWERIKEQVARVDGGLPPSAKLAKPPMKPQLVQPTASAIPPTQEEYEQEARRLAKGNGPRDGYHDDKYVGASS